MLQEQSIEVQGFRASLQQRRIFRLLGAQPALRACCAVEIEGSLGSQALKEALLRVVGRHQILRTVFLRVPGIKIPLQVIQEQGSIFWQSLDWRRLAPRRQQEGLDELFEQEGQASFDLESGPAVRAWRIALAKRRQILILSLPSLCADAQTLRNLVGELARACRPSPESLGQEDEIVQYVQFSEWQAELLEDQQEAGKKYWQEAISGLDALTLPFEAGTPPSSKPGWSFHAWHLGRQAAEKAARLARGCKASEPAVYLACLQALLFRMTGCSDISIAHLCEGRKYEELQGALGLFDRYLPIRCRFDADPPFSNLLEQLQSSFLEAEKWQECFEGGEVGLEGNGAAPGIGFDFDQDAPAFAAADTSFRILKQCVDLEPCKLRLCCTRRKDGVLASLRYDPNLFKADDIQQLAARYQALLQGLLDNPERPVGDVEILGQRERSQLLVEFNRTQQSLPAACLHQEFERQARQRPDAVAIEFAEQRLSYAELDSRASRLAGFVRRRGAKQGDLVAICMERSPQMALAILGALKAGAAYLPLDLSYPPARSGYILRDAPAALLLTQRRLCLDFAPQGLRVVAAEEVNESTEELKQGDIAGQAAPDQLAYVLYTSGSTGQPKGVMVTQRGLINYLSWCREAYQLESGRGAPVHSAIGFDLTVTSLFSPWMAGRSVSLLPEGEGLQALAEALCSGQPFSLVKLTPAHLKALSHLLPAPEALAGPGVLVVGGEALRGEDLTFWRDWAPGTRLINEYGPTEAVVGCCAHEVRPEDFSGPVPIGRPVANTRIYLVNPHLRPVPCGVAGELLIGGSGLARGYFGRAGQTAERFIPDSLSGQAGERLYRSGDLARLRSDGAAEFLGRFDNQVKVRGYRVELGEVEAVLSRHPEVRESAVTAREDAPGEVSLAAYWVPGSDPPADSRELLSYLHKQLPEYMIPSAFVRLPALPLSAHGKVDRAALPPPQQGARTGRDEHLEPRTECEQILAGIWALLLRRERIGAQHDFFELGGHSLLGAQLISRIRQAFQVEVTLRDLFEAPTLSGLAEAVESKRREERVPPPPPIAPAPRDRRLPLSFSQQRLWFLDQFRPATSAYNISTAVRLSGRLDIAVLKQVQDKIVSRHEALRTRFRAVNGEPVQVISAPRPQPLPLIDLEPIPQPGREQECRRIVNGQSDQPFDLSRDSLIRTLLIRLGPAEHAAVLTLHHIVSDGWSQEVLVREMAELYQAFSAGRPSPLPELPIQYADFAYWQRQWLRGEVLESHLSYWKKQLKDPTALELPYDRPRPTVQTFPGRVASAFLPGSLLEAFKSLSLANSVTLFMALLAAFKTLLQRSTTQADIAVGTPTANRSKLEIENLIGFFVNTLVMRTDLSSDPTFQELLARVRDTVLEASAHQELPFEHLVEVLQPERHINRTPLFQVLFVLESGSQQQSLELPGLTLSEMDAEATTAKFDLTFFLRELPAGILALAEYNTDLFDATTIARWMDHFERLLKEIVEAPGARISSYSLLNPAERHQILAEWNDTEAPQPDAGAIQGLFEAQASRRADKVALTFGQEAWSYAYLNQRANQLAFLLRSQDLQAGGLVALLLNRSPWMAAALLGILKAGGAYVPLSASFPAARMQWILRSLGIRWLVTQQSWMTRLGEALQDVASLEHLVNLSPKEAAQAPGAASPPFWPHPLDGHPVENPSRLTDPEGLAYIIFTSGSTGNPKGVAVRHRPVLNLIRWVNSTFQVGPSDQVLFITALSFDLSVYDVFGLLAAGGSLRVASQAEVDEPQRLVSLLCQEPITYWDSAPAALQQLEPFFPAPGALAATPSLRLVFLSGDWIPLGLPDRVRQSFPGAEVVGLGGATEATVWSNHHRIGEIPPSWVSIPYGRPIANARYHVLDSAFEPRPIGQPGDLYIGAGCLAMGYAGDPSLTAEKFVPDPFGLQAGGRLYRTGDRARYWSDGELQFLGRLDHQVKIRGFRIELGEIESVLNQHPAVAEAVAMVRESPPGNRRLVAFALPQEGGMLPLDELRELARQNLPEYMLPSALVKVASWPTTPNGKLDRKALLALEPERPGRSQDFVAPRTPVEELLSETWSQVLNVSKVGLDDDFFELGGHSLLATQVISRMRSAFGIELALRCLFEAPTVRGIAGQVEAALRGEKALQAPALVPVRRDAGLPLSFAQQRLWFLHQLNPLSPASNIASAVEISGPLRIAALQQALSHIVERHEVLRTTFAFSEEEPLQVIAEARRLPLPVADLRGLGQALLPAVAQGLIRQEATAPFDLAAGPLLRVRLLRADDERYLILLTMHHIIGDGWSMGLLVQEVTALYEAFSRGRPSPLHDLPVQYGDFAVWQRRWLQGEVLDKEISYWRKQLAGAPAQIDLPTDRPRPRALSSRGRSCSFRLSAQLSRSLTRLGRQSGATLFMIGLAAFQALLHRCTGQRDLQVGTPVAGRNRLETEPLIGFFINTLILRARLSQEPTFEEILIKVREAALEAHAHQDLPFEKLVEELKPERSLNQTPLFNVLFVLQNFPAQSGRTSDLRLRPVGADTDTSNFDLEMTLAEQGPEIHGELQYNVDLFDDTTIRRMVLHFELLLKAAAEDPACKIASLQLLTAGERHQLLVEWDAVGTQWDESAAHQLFERQARALPDAAALTFQGEALSYGELNALSNRLARGLRTLGLEQGQKAATLLGDGPLQAIALLGVLKGGCAFVCLDPDYPSGRQRPILEELAPQFVLTDQRCLAGHGALLQGLTPGGGRVAVLDAPDGGGVEGAVGRDALQGCSGADLGLSVPLGDPAYVAYTSGSTGRPKGIVQSQRGLSQFLQWQSRRFGIGPSSRVANWASISYDASYCEIFGALCFGARLCLAGKAVRFDPPALAAWLIQERITLLQTVPSFGRQLLQALGPGADPLPEMEALLLAGEALPAELARRWTGRFPARPRLFNLYGPTESVLATCCPVDAEAAARPSVPVGRAIEGRQILLLDGGGQPCPIGVAGEVFIRSPYLTLGYFERPEETRRSFVANPLPDGRPEPAYRTGDLGKWLPDGRLAFLGRRDNQVKIRGMRVELEDIESALLQEEAVGECAVAVQDYGQGDQRLAAFLVPEKASLSAEKSSRLVGQVRGSLRRRLPRHMVPSSLTVLDSLPRTRTGKLDRQALRELCKPRPLLDQESASRMAELLERHEAVKECAVLARESNLGEPQLVAYLVGDSDSPAGSAIEKALIGDHLKHYQEIYDGVYGQQGKYSGQHRGLNLRIWISSYTGQPFAEHEILQGVEDIERRILSLKPQSLLEIGCGSGLLYFRVGPHCKRYVGTDISQAGLRHLKRQRAGHGGPLPESRFLHRAAHDLEGLEGERFDTVVINDVAIYFPSLGYLARVLERALGALRPGGAVYLGGLRSLPLQEAFHLSVALHQAPDEMPLSQVQRRARQRVAADKELVIDPAFFLRLRQAMPGLGQARIELKQGSSQNEVTCFQYDVFLHAAGDDPAPLQARRWLDWEAEGLSLQALQSLLCREAPEAFGFTGIPNARLCSTLAIADYVGRAPKGATAGDAKAVLGRASGEAAVDPEDLWALAERLCCDVSIGWLDSRPDGRCQAVFRRRPADRPGYWDVDFLSLPGRDRKAAGGRSHSNHPISKALDDRTAARLRQHLEEGLPGHPLPEAFVAMDRLPRQPDGSVDETALPTPEDLGLGGAGESQMTSSALESRIAAICRGFLRIDRMGRQDSFFDLGGHSLLATRVLNKLRQAFAVEPSLRSFFERPTVAELARQVEAAWAKGRGAAQAPILGVPRKTGRHPLSFSQERLWFLHQLEPQSAAYNLFASVRLQGKLHLRALRESLTQVIQRHESLRATFQLDEEGEAVQIISPLAQDNLRIIDLRRLPEPERQRQALEVTNQEAGSPFDLGAGPMLRACLLQIGREGHVLILSIHHIVSDGWSVGVLVRELTQLYAAFRSGRPSPLPDLPVGYIDYVYWQRQLLQGEALQALLGYWKRQLAGAPVLQLPADRPRPATRSYRGKREAVELPPALAERLKAISQEEGATLFMTLLAAFKVLLSRYSAQEDIVVGIDTANRSRAETEGMIGFMVNQLALRTDLSGIGSFREVVRRVRRTALDAYSHQDLPFQRLVSALQPERVAGTSPLFQVMFSFQEAQQAPRELGGLALSSLPDGLVIARFDLTLRITLGQQSLMASLEYSRDIFDPPTIVLMLKRFQILLSQAAENPDAPLSMDLVTKEEKEHRKALNLQRLKKVRPQAVALDAQEGE